MDKWMAVGFAFVTHWCWFLRLKLHAFPSLTAFSCCMCQAKTTVISDTASCFSYECMLKWHWNCDTVYPLNFAPWVFFLFLKTVTVNFFMVWGHCLVHTHSCGNTCTLSDTESFSFFPPHFQIHSLIQHLWFFYWLSLLTFEPCYIFLISILFIKKIFQLYNTVYSCALVSIKLAFMNLGSRIFY